MELTEKQNVQIKADLIEIEYFTDPLCCWSWAFETHWRRFIIENSGSIRWKYRMAGLIPDWKKYNDPVNDVSNPAQMAPYWLQVSQMSGVAINESIWNEDPPKSSYPACIAVKTAEMQSREAADIYLQELREAVMLKKKNIAKTEILVGIVRELESLYPDKIHSCKFEHDLFGDKSRELFKEDLLLANYSRIGRFPAIVMSKKNKNSILIVGYRPYSALMDAFLQLQA